MTIRKASLILFLFCLVPIALACKPNLNGNGENPEATDAQRDFAHQLTLQGIERLFDIHLPPNYDGTTPLPLLIGMHGGGGSREGFRETSQLETYCDAAGYIVVYPEGTANHYNSKREVFDVKIPHIIPELPDPGKETTN